MQVQVNIDRNLGMMAERLGDQRTSDASSITSFSNILSNISEAAGDMSRDERSVRTENSAGRRNVDKDSKVARSESNTDCAETKNDTVSKKKTKDFSKTQEKSVGQNANAKKRSEVHDHKSDNVKESSSEKNSSELSDKEEIETNTEVASVKSEPVKLSENIVDEIYLNSDSSEELDNISVIETPLTTMISANSSVSEETDELTPLSDLPISEISSKSKDTLETSNAEIEIIDDVETNFENEDVVANMVDEDVNATDDFVNLLNDSRNAKPAVSVQSTENETEPLSEALSVKNEEPEISIEKNEDSVKEQILAKNLSDSDVIDENNQISDVNRVVEKTKIDEPEKTEMLDELETVSVTRIKSLRSETQTLKTDANSSVSQNIKLGQNSTEQGVSDEEEIVSLINDSIETPENTENSESTRVDLIAEKQKVTVSTDAETNQDLNQISSLRRSAIKTSSNNNLQTQNANVLNETDFRNVVTSSAEQTEKAETMVATVATERVMKSATTAEAKETNEVVETVASKDDEIDTTIDFDKIDLGQKSFAETLKQMRLAELHSSRVTETSRPTNIHQSVNDMINISLGREIASASQNDVNTIKNSGISATSSLDSISSVKESGSITAAINDRNLQTNDLKNQEIQELQKPIHMSRNYEENARQVAEKINMMISRNMKEAELNLDPVGLGKMKISVQISDDGIARVNMVVQQSETKDLVYESMNRLREFMEQKGLSLGESSVEQQNTWADNSQNGETSHNASQSSDTIASDDILESVNAEISVSDSAVDYFA